MAKSGDLLQRKCECCLRHSQSLMQYEHKSCPSRSNLPTCGLSEISAPSFSRGKTTGQLLASATVRSARSFRFSVILSWSVSRPSQHVILGNMMRYVTVHFHVTRYVHFVWLENCILLGYYAACNGNSLPTFRDNISVPSTSSSKADHSHRAGRRTNLPLLLNGLNFFFFYGWKFKSYILKC